MDGLRDIAHPAGRVLMSLVFVLAGFSKLGDVQGFSQYMVSGGIPASLAWPVILFEIAAGLAVLFGFQTRIAAFFLAGYSLLTAFLYHFDPADPVQMEIMIKNVALAGGLMVLFAAGAGKYAVDSRR